MNPFDILTSQSADEKEKLGPTTSRNRHSTPCQPPTEKKPNNNCRAVSTASTLMCPRQHHRWRDYEVR